MNEARVVSASQTRLLLWGVAVVFVLDMLFFAIQVGPVVEAIRIDVLPVLFFGTMAALLSRQGTPSIIATVPLAFAAMIQGPFLLFTQGQCGAGVSNVVLTFVLTPLLFASPIHAVPTLAASFALSQWVLRRMHLISAAVASVGFICLAAAAWWFVVSKMPGTISCPNF